MPACLRAACLCVYNPHRAGRGTLASSITSIQIGQLTSNTVGMHLTPNYNTHTHQCQYETNAFGREHVPPLKPNAVVKDHQRHWGARHAPTKNAQTLDNGLSTLDKIRNGSLIECWCVFFFWCVVVIVCTCPIDVFDWRLEGMDAAMRKQR